LPDYLALHFRACLRVAASAKAGKAAKKAKVNMVRPAIFAKSQILLIAISIIGALLY